MVLAVEDCVQFREEVQTTLDDLVQGQKEAQAEVTKILDCPTHREAQQLLLIHQVLWGTISVFFFQAAVVCSERSYCLISLFFRTAATVKEIKAEEKGRSAADNKRPAAPN